MLENAQHEALPRTVRARIALRRALERARDDAGQLTFSATLFDHFEAALVELWERDRMQVADPRGLARLIRVLLEDEGSSSPAAGAVIGQSGLRGSWNRVFAAERSAYLAEWLAPFLAAPVLDLLAGDGHVAEELSKRVQPIRAAERVLGDAVDWSRTRVQFAPFVADFVDAESETILLCAVLHHEEDPLALLRRISAWPAKRWVVVENCLDTRWDADIHQLIDLFFNRCLNNIQSYCGPRHRTAQDWAELLSRYGTIAHRERRDDVPGIPFPYDLYVVERGPCAAPRVRLRSADQRLASDAAVHAHLAQLASGLGDEIGALNGGNGLAAPSIARLEAALSDPAADFYDVADLYREAAGEKAVWVGRRAEIAARYDSMDAFWHDAAEQQRGRSPRTFWDSYEHGRRRQLEAVLADAYGADEAVLVNSGMAALDVALGAAELRPGCRVLVHERAYFETAEYLEYVAARRGIEVVRVDMTAAERVDDALRAHDPAAILVETSLNCPPCDAPVLTDALLGHRALLVVDNSLLSHAVPVHRLLDRNRVLVVESAIKYLTRTCMGGVVYGSGDAITAARCYARRIGVQLQERAFAGLQVAELLTARERVALHGRNNRAFVAALAGERWAWVRTATSSIEGRRDPLARAVRTAGAGALVYACIGGAGASDQAAVHRRLIAEWVRRARLRGLRLDVRAGFGWDETTVRAYESSALNQQDAPVYVRVSLGIEPEVICVELARLLNEVAAELS